MLKTLSRLRHFLLKQFSKPALKKPNSPIPNSPKPVMFFDKAMPQIALRHIERSKPTLSIVVIVYKMPRQAIKTLHSLSMKYQRGISSNDYEVIVVENSSEENLTEKEVTQFGGNFKYFVREETAPTPVHAVNFGASKARGEHIVLMIDGARMVTPGVLNYMLAASYLTEYPVISVPGYHLGHELQQISISQGYNHDVENQLLDSINWPEDGYRLFEIACLSGTSVGGFLKPIGESNCLSVPKSIWEELGGIDTNFVLTGGGQSNLDLYKRAVEHPKSVLITLAGEGSFHQVHGGVTTGQTAEEKRRKIHEGHFAEYTAMRGQPYSPPEKRSIYLGAFPDSSLKYVQHSAAVVRRDRGEIK